MVPYLSNHIFLVVIRTAKYKHWCHRESSQSTLSHWWYWWWRQILRLFRLNRITSWRQLSLQYFIRSLQMVHILTNNYILMWLMTIHWWTRIMQFPHKCIFLYKFILYFTNTQLPAHHMRRRLRYLFQPQPSHPLFLISNIKYRILISIYSLTISGRPPLQWRWKYRIFVIIYLLISISGRSRRNLPRLPNI